MWISSLFTGLWYIMRHLFDVIQCPFTYLQLIQLFSFFKNSIKMANYYVPPSLDTFIRDCLRLSSNLLVKNDFELPDSSVSTSLIFLCWRLNPKLWQTPYQLRYIPSPSIRFVVKCFACFFFFYKIMLYSLNTICNPKWVFIKPTLHPPVSAPECWDSQLFATTYG